MSKNIAQVFSTNPITTLSSTYLLYVGQDGTDAAIQVGSIFPSSATNTAVAIYDGTTGSKLKNSVLLVSAGGNLTGIADLTASGTIQSATVIVTGLSGTSLVATTVDKTLTSSTSGLTPTFTNLVLSGLTANTALYANGSKTIVSQALTNGQLQIGSTGAAPVAALPTASGNITITPGAGTLAFSLTGIAGISFADDTTTPIALTVNSGHIANMGSLLTYTLPTTCAKGAIIWIQGQGAGGWTITQAASQLIHIGSVVSTTGVGGSVSSSNRYDSLMLVCITANLEFAALGGPQGNLTIV